MRKVLWMKVLDVPTSIYISHALTSLFLFLKPQFLGTN
jgi:hypothetical protein